MKSLKPGLIVLIVIAILAGAYFIANPKRQSAISDEKSSNIKLSSLEPAYSVPEKYNEKNNLTKALGQNLFKQIQTDNLLGKENKDLPTDIDSLSEKLANNIISESLADFKLVSIIYDSDINISSDTSKEAKFQYLKTITEVNQKNFGSFNKNYLQVIVDVYQKIDPYPASRLANIYKNLTADFLKVSVPADWVDIHKMLIIYVKNSEIAYRAMANYPVDPIKGYLAIETIDSLVNST